MQLSKFLSFSRDKLTSTTPPTKATQVGASTAEVYEDHYNNHHNLLKWIHETKQKLPAATPQIRREAFLADPLLKGTIYPYLKNVLLQGFTIQTKDNKLYAEALEEITDYLESLELMQVFREDFLNYVILDGHSYRRMDPDLTGNIVKLEKIEPSSVTTYTDPWDSSIIAYHQRARINSSWSSLGTSTDVDSWFIPFGKDLKDIYATFIQDRESGNNPAVYDLFEKYRTLYNISNIGNLRIASSERILAMHNSIKLISNSYYEEEDARVTNPAPIDSVLLAIWLKRLLLVNSPNLIFIVLSPFLHLKMGIMKESKDFAGNPIILSSLPQKPLEGSVNYAAEDANYKAFEAALQDSMKTLLKCLKEGGVFASGPDQELKPVESTRSVSFQLIQGLINNLNEEICQGFGLPIALISAKGTELASSRNIVQVFNSIQAGNRLNYEHEADKLILKQFDSKTWAAKTTDENGKETTVTYSLKDIKAHFVLDVPDVKDLLNEAQVIKTKAEALVQVKSIGGSQNDLQALGEEYGFGLLDLANYGAENQPIDAQQINAVLKACLFKAMQGERLISAVDPTAPSGFKEKKINKMFQEAYETAQETIDTIFEE